MQGVLVVCLILCIGAVCCQERPLPDRQYPVDPIRPWPFYVQYPDRCYRRFGRYVTTNVNLTPQPVTVGNTRYFFHQCFYYKPSYSECTGGCSSQQRLYIDPYRHSKTCKCCQAQGCQIVPVKRVYCRYIFAYNGCRPPTLTSGWVYDSHPTRPTHPYIRRLRYYVVDRCGCSDCPRRRDIREEVQRQVNLDLPEEFRGLQGEEVESEADVQGLEAPPTVVPRASFDERVVDQQKAVHQTTLRCAVADGPIALGPIALGRRGDA